MFWEGRCFAEFLPGELAELAVNLYHAKGFDDCDDPNCNSSYKHYRDRFPMPVELVPGGLIDTVTYLVELIMTGEIKDFRLSRDAGGVLTCRVPIEPGQMRPDGCLAFLPARLY